MLGHYEQAETLLSEASQLSMLLTNPDLSFFIRLQHILLKRDQGNTEEAAIDLQELLDNSQRLSQQALVTYELWKTTGYETWRQKALDRYKHLRTIADSHTVRSRLQDLQTKKSS